MKTIVVLCLCAVVVMGAPSGDRSAPAVEHTDERDELGQYTLRYVTGEGTVVSERGRFVPTADGTGRVLVYEGEFKFVGDDGKVYITKYTAGAEGGYKAEGDHLPVAPEVPDVPLPEPPKIEVPVVEGAEGGYKAEGDHLPVAPEVPDVPLPEPPKIEVPVVEAEPIV